MRQDHWTELCKEWRNALRSPLYWLAWAILGAAILASCGSSSAPSPNATPDRDGLTADPDYGFVRHIDKDAGIVCWTWVRGGIHCLPTEQTDLGER